MGTINSGDIAWMLTSSALQQFQLRKRIAGFAKPALNITYGNSQKSLRKSRKQRVRRPGFDLSQDGFQL